MKNKWTFLVVLFVLGVLLAAAVLPQGAAQASEVRTPPTSPVIDGLIGADWDVDELVVDDSTSDSPWGSGNELNNLYVTWDATKLYVGVEYTIDNNALVVYVDTGVSGGETDFNSGNGYTGAYPRNFTMSGRDIDLMLARWNKSETPQVYAVVDNGTTEISGQATISATETAVEYAIPWSQILKPNGGQICLTAVIAGGDNYGGPDSMPDNASTNGDGGPDVIDQFYCISLGTIIINEVDADNTSTDSAEFIEIYDGGVGNTPLFGYSLIFYNGSSDLSYEAFDLDAYMTDVDGYFVLCGDPANVPNCDYDAPKNTDLIQNGQDAIGLYLANASSFPLNSALTLVNLVDAIIYGTDDPDDAGLQPLLNIGQPQLNEDAKNNATTVSNQRCPNGSGGARNTSTYDQYAPTSGVENFHCPSIGAGISVDKTGPETIDIGGTITYTIMIWNHSDFNAKTVLTDTMPSGTTYLTSTIAPDPAGIVEGILVWDLGTINAHSTYTLYMTATVATDLPAQAVLTNTVVILTDQGEDPVQDNRSSWETVVNAFYDMDASSSSQPGIVYPGTIVTYTVTITNEGNISDTYLLSGTSTELGWPFSLSKDQLVLNAGETGTFKIIVTVPLTATDGLQDIHLARIVADTGTSVKDIYFTTTAMWHRLFLPLVTKG